MNDEEPSQNTELVTNDLPNPVRQTDEELLAQQRAIREEATELRKTAIDIIAKAALLDEKADSIDDQIPRKPWDLEIRRNEDNSLDEIVCDGAFVHLEQMSDTHWWMAITKGDKTVHVNFASKKKIKAHAELD